MVNKRLLFTLFISTMILTVFIIYYTSASWKCLHWLDEGRDKERYPTEIQNNTESEYLRLKKGHQRCRVLPDVLIFGFDKCGTMTLRRFLSVHPNIYITRSSGNNKFFQTNHFKTLAEYAKTTECTPDGHLRLEKLLNQRYPENVYKYIPDVKLIAIVKEPSERVLSHFVHMVVQAKKAITLEDFEVCVTQVLNSVNVSSLSKTTSSDSDVCVATKRMIRGSIYSNPLEKWIRVFGSDKILIIDGDNFVTNPVKELRKAEQFIGLEPKIKSNNFVFDKEKKFFCVKFDGSAGCMSEKKGRRHPFMSNSTRSLLKDYFKPYNKDFYKLAGRTFSWGY